MNLYSVYEKFAELLKTQSTITSEWHDDFEYDCKMVVRRVELQLTLPLINQGEYIDLYGDLYIDGEKLIRWDKIRILPSPHGYVYFWHADSDTTIDGATRFSTRDIMEVIKQ